MRAKRLMVATLAAGLLVSATIIPTWADDHPLRGVAMVIGESRYVRLAQLSNPATDARAIDDMLYGLGFEVDRVLDANTAQLKQRIDEFAAHSTGADVVLVYYGGHGVEVGGKDYLLGIDADVSSDTGANESLISVDDILARLQDVAPITIILLDACRTNPFAPGQMLQPAGMATAQPVASAGLAMIVRGPTPLASGPASDGTQAGGTVIGFSASPGQAAADGDKGANSPYAAALLEHLVASGYSFADEMTLVSEEVYVNTRARQLPWTNSSLNRILYFGGTAPVSDPDDAAMLAERRQLLLTIAAVPVGSRQVVEQVADDSDVGLVRLYAALHKIEKSRELDPDELRNLAIQLSRANDESEPLPVTSDPELLRLDKLAREATDLGATDLASKYRHEALDRGEQILTNDAVQLASLLAKAADADSANLDSKKAAQENHRAAKVVAKFDKGRAFKYRLREADAYAQQAFAEDDLDATNKAIALFHDLLLEVDQATDPLTWAHIQLQLAQTIRESSWRTSYQDFDAQQEMYKRAELALTVYDREHHRAEWIQAKQAEADGLKLGGANYISVGILQEIVDAMRPGSPQWGQAEIRVAYELSQIAELTITTPPWIKARDAYAAALAGLGGPSGHHAEWIDAKRGLALTNGEVAFHRVDADGMRAASDDLLALVPMLRSDEGWLGQNVGRSIVHTGIRAHDPKAVQVGLDLLRKTDKIDTIDKGAALFIYHAQPEAAGLLYIGTELKSLKTLKRARAIYAALLDAEKTYGVPSHIFNAQQNLKRADAAIAALVEGR